MLYGKTCKARCYITVISIGVATEGRAPEFGLGPVMIFVQNQWLVGVVGVVLDQSRKMH